MRVEVPTVLETLVAATAEELEKRKAETPLARLMEMIEGQRPARHFVGAISGPGMRLIAEIKRASPSKGELNAAIDAPALAQEYERAGASAISVLTESRYFKGSLADLAAVSAAVGIPCLRKDFVVDAYQVYEARACGADAVLLIAAILSDEQMASFLDITGELGLGVLIEVHDKVELSRVLAVLEEAHVLTPTSVGLIPPQKGPPISERIVERIPRGKRGQAQGIAIGVNNRNLADFTVDLGTTLRLCADVPAEITLVGESGIHSREDVRRLEAAGVNAILVGEALVTSANPRERVRELLGIEQE